MSDTSCITFTQSNDGNVTIEAHMSSWNNNAAVIMLGVYRLALDTDLEDLYALSPDSAEDAAELYTTIRTLSENKDDE